MTKRGVRGVPVGVLVVAGLWVLVMAALPLLVVALWGHELPDPVAQHWGLDGVPNEVTPLATAWVFPTVFTVAMAGLLAGLGAGLGHLRTMLAASVGLATFTGGLFAGLLATQRGATSASEPRTALVDAAIAGAIIAGVVVGAAFGWLTRRRPAPDARRVVGGTRAVPEWRGELRGGPGMVWVAALAPVLLGGFAVALFTQRMWATGGLMLLLAAALGVAVPALMRPVLVVDAAGVRALAFGRWAVVDLPWGDIAGADEVTVSWGEFGGLGLRARIDSDGSWGLISASGPAVRLRRVDAGDYYLTAADAAGLASRVNEVVRQGA